MLPFCCHRGLSNGEKPYFTGFFTGVKLFPLVAEKLNLTHFVYKMYRVVFAVF